MKEIIQIIRGVFRVEGKGVNSFSEVLDAQSECCGGWNCCRQGLIGEDHDTHVKMIGYFKSGVWTIKTLADFDANGA